MRSIYDESKRYGEAMIYAYHRTYQLDVRVIRIFNTYGPRMDPEDGRVVTNLMFQALRTVAADRQGFLTGQINYLTEHEAKEAIKAAEGAVKAWLAGYELSDSRR